MPDADEIARARITQILATADALDEQAVANALRLVDQLRRELIAELAGNMTAYQRGTVEDILRAMDRLVFEFRTRYAAEVAALQARAFDVGSLLVDSPLQGVTARYFAPHIGRELLEVAQGYSADLIRGVAADVREAVSGEIRRGVLAGRSPFEVMQRIGSRIDRGVFASIAQRAEVITRTEVNRVMSIAADVRMTQASRLVPTLQRQWLATLDDRTRESHRKAHEQVRAIGAPFDIGGEPLGFPGDPAGSPQETINCRCRAVPYAVSWTDVVDPSAATHIVPDWVRARIALAPTGTEGARAAQVVVNRAPAVARPEPERWWELPFDDFLVAHPEYVSLARTPKLERAITQFQRWLRRGTKPVADYSARVPAALRDVRVFTITEAEHRRYRAEAFVWRLGTPRGHEPLPTPPFLGLRAATGDPEFAVLHELGHQAIHRVGIKLRGPDILDEIVSNRFAERLLGRSSRLSTEQVLGQTTRYGGRTYRVTPEVEAYVDELLNATRTEAEVAVAQARGLEAHACEFGLVFRSIPHDDLEED